MVDLPSRARVVVVGGGVIGTSVAYHLTKLGWTDVLLLEQGTLHTGMQRCMDEGISVVIGAPYASGILATGPIDGARYAYGFADEAIKAKTRAIQAVAARHGVSLQAAALQFPLAHPAVISVIPGGARPEEVTANVNYLTEVIPVDFWAELKAEGLIVADAPVPAA